NSKNLPSFVATVMGGGELDPIDEFVRQLAALTGLMENEPAQIAVLHAIAQSNDDTISIWQLTALDGLLTGLERRHQDLGHLWRQGTEEMGRMERQVQSLCARAESTVSDSSANIDVRLRAVRLVGRLAAHKQADLGLLGGLLSPQTSAALQTAAVAALAATGDQKAPQMLLAGWSGYSPELRGQVVDRLVGRDEWLQQLLAQVKSQNVAAVAIDAARRQRILQHPKEDIRRQAEEVFAGAVNADRQQVVDRYQESLNLVGSADGGAAAFKKSCATCHRLAEVGHVVGPDLSALSDRSPQAMLTAIFDPNRAVEAKFLNYTAITNDGVTYSGMLAAETGNSVTLLAADGKETSLLRNDLEALASSAKSLMPEGLEKDLSPQDVSDLLAYLSGFRPPRKTFEGNEPKVVQPEALRGEFWLLAQDCEIYGKTLIFEPQYHNLGYWQSDDDHAVWSCDVTRPGKYAVSLDYACDNSAAGQTVAVEVADQRLTAKVAGSGNWDTYRQLQLGQVELPSGVQQLVVRPDGRLHGPLIDLKSVRLRPVK
ncbi:MAG TPA: c-type cytochrome, partial [Pirellulales bacterium]|nr:c-type cytochrome [Pirellulales bacterium]